MKPFKAYRIYKDKEEIVGRLEELSLDDLNQGDVLIRAAYSSVNYKDALGVTGRGKIFKHFPITAGIDVSGTVETSTDNRFKSGDQVIVTGCGIGESLDGGYAQYSRVPADCVVSLPDGLTLYEAMVFGTAGFTAALSIHRMEVNGQVPKKGPIVVTGATGGVGSLAICMLHSLGYEVVAVTGKSGKKDFLRSLGANKVVSAEELGLGTKPLESAKWGGAIDNVGGEILSGLIPCVHLWGNIACVGNTGGAVFKTTVMPMILRGVSLLGISSNNCPMSLRQKLWQRLATDLKPSNLKQIVTKEIALESIKSECEEMLSRRTYGRIIVNCQ